MCISLPGQLQQTVTNWVTSDNRDLSSRSSGGQKPEIKVWQDAESSEDSRKESFLVSSSSWQHLAFLGSRLHQSNLPLSSCDPFSVPSRLNDSSHFTEEETEAQGRKNNSREVTQPGGKEPSPNDPQGLMWGPQHCTTCRGAWHSLLL